MQTFETLRHAVFGRTMRALRRERGSMLIEVMVGSLILAITTTAVLSGLDGAQKTGGRNKARSVAAALAEQDQERMRSLPVADLLPLVATPYTRPVSVKGVNYTVTSSASYATDPGSASTGCSASAKTQTNLRILSSVTSPLTRGNVDVVGLVTPPASSGYAAGQGRLIVKVFDRDDEGVAGVTVASAAPPPSRRRRTRRAARSSRSLRRATTRRPSRSSAWSAGRANNPLAPAPALTATAGQTTTYGPYYMEQPATINAQFDTKVGSAAAASRRFPLRRGEQREAHLAAQGLRRRRPRRAGPRHRPLPVPGRLRPLRGAVHPPERPRGRAPQHDPEPGRDARHQSQDPRALDQHPRARARTASRGRPVTAPFTSVFVKPADGCATTYPSQNIANTTTGGLASLPKPGYPYGTYKLCAQRTVSGVTTARARRPEDRGRRRRLRHDRQTTTAAAETAANRVDDTITNTNANGVPALAANPIYPASPALPASISSIIIRLNRTGPCE